MSDIQKVSVALTNEQITALRAAVESGEYATASEAVREALRDWQWKRRMRNEDIERLRKLWQEGKNSGEMVRVDFAATHKLAQRRLKKAQGKAR
jgi:antitoxin ParD1/3/4